MNDLEKLCPEFLQTPNAAGIIAFLFNEFMDLEMRMAVPDAVAQQIGQYMQANGYGIVFNKFYKQRKEQILESVQQDYEEVMEDHRRLVRELDVLINGEEGAAKQASLCDIVAQVRREGLKVPQPADADESMWCRYIATMIGGYLGEPVGSDKEKAIAGIIERRLWNLPKKEAPAVAVNEQMLTALKLAQFFVEELTNAAGKYAGLEGQVVADAYMVSAKLNIAIAAYEAAKKGGAE